MKRFWLQTKKNLPVPTSFAVGTPLLSLASSSRWGNFRFTDLLINARPNELRCRDTPPFSRKLEQVGKFSIYRFTDLCPSRRASLSGHPSFLSQARAGGEIFDLLIHRYIRSNVNSTLRINRFTHVLIPNSFISSSLHLLITSSPHHFISSSLHLRITSSPHHFISSSLHLLITSSLHPSLPQIPQQAAIQGADDWIARDHAAAAVAAY